MKSWTKPAFTAATLLIAGAFLSSVPEGEPLRYARAATPPASVSSVTILFGGDMLFDRTIRTAMERQGDDHVFSCIAALLREVDMVVANLEGPITAHFSKSVGTKPGAEGNYTFTFPISTASLLARHNFGFVNIGNNHILNFGQEGLASTKQWLRRAGVGFFGDPDLFESERVARISLRGIPFSFVSWSDWTSSSEAAVITQVRVEKEGGRVVVVYAHWGEEYQPATERMKVLARTFVDAGAKIVIGSHPHIVQEHEVYKKAHIYYSLGNFIFDQYWEESVRRGLLVRASFAPTGIVSVEEIPIDNQTDRRTCAV